MKISDREIGLGQPPFIIAEVSCNHGGDVQRALELIDAAKDCGADAVKFQCFTPDTMTLDCDRPEFIVADGPWKGRRLYDLYRSTQTPFVWFPEIAKRAFDVGIPWFASVFDKSSVDLMVELDAPAIKIASFEIVDLPLIRYAAATSKLFILSTGMASDDEVVAAMKVVQANLMPGKIPNAIALHCVAGYPTPVSEANLSAMTRSKPYEWGWNVGISDPTTGIEVPIAATALGACIIEKHFRLSFHPKAEDSPFSLDEVEFSSMTRAVRNIWAAMQPRPAASEAAHRPLRRSLFAVEDIKAGTMFSKENIRTIRPGHGAPPANIDRFIGKLAARNIARGEPLQFGMIKP
jgi:pseudaminic acid synthase